MNKRNAIIMAAGTSSRFVPLSAERPKGLVEVKGEVLIERQIRQLKEAGIADITLVVGYKAEMFTYLCDKYGVEIVLNEDYARYNNTSSLIRVIDKLDNTFVCSSDNYFPENVFMNDSDDSYYSALYAERETNEYCLTTDADDYITDVRVGGCDAWYMVGHVFFNREFSEAFRNIMTEEYKNDTTRKGYWEDLYIRYIDQLPKMKINRYKEGEIQEFDSLDELRLFDDSYIADTRSIVVKSICRTLNLQESDVYDFKNIKHVGDYLHFQFKVGDTTYEYNDKTEIRIEKI
ncbi:choline-phosphate cytidylyltransferase [Prevotella sp. P4-98]|uniref:NTP transferase domain-containing protein n=1 Tax=Prevotella sp. P4-98 TaxID=2024219 RepID=UPI000B9668EA|nr:NTP transferase domain-containing protein [Prevotella sp. P4-98]OYP44138.1 choline-phosphate cytidylyltransferase [Prevotella sp. P4-98]